MWSITRPSPWARWWKTPRTKPAPNTAFHNARRSLLRRAFSLFGPRPFPDPASALQRHMRQQVSAPLGGDLSLSAWSADRDEASPLWDAVRINGCRGGLGRPRGNPSTPGVGFDLWSFRRRGKQPLQGKRRASTAPPLQGLKNGIGGCRGGLWPPPGETHTPGVGFDLWSFRRRGKHAPTGETAGEHSSPLQGLKSGIGGCRGGLWPSPGETHRHQV